MSDEFALCWNNFTENITTGFQSLLLRGDLCDCTLAVDGKLLKVHKVVLSICSPYFELMFSSLPNNQHPILILKDMKAALVANLLQFMYQGSVNVKQDELQAFMKIAETLQIKGLTSSTKEPKPKTNEANKGAKRSLETDESPKDKKAHIDLTNDDDVDPNTSDDHFTTIPFPEISLVEPRFEMNSRDSTSDTQSQPSCNLKISESQSLCSFSSFEFNHEQNVSEDVPTKNSNAVPEIPNEVPSSGSSITMLSSTSLLHGNCVFNRNNTVATQAGLKTYWLCKSYRISMCKARCITHQGKVISATGTHNHHPHMNNKPQEMCSSHTPTVFIPNNSSNDYLLSSNSMQSHLAQHPATNQYYHTNQLNQHLMDQHVNLAMDSRHCLQNSSPMTDISYKASPRPSSTGNNQLQCKVEHI